MIVKKRKKKRIVSYNLNCSIDFEYFVNVVSLIKCKVKKKKEKKVFRCNVTESFTAKEKDG